MIEMDHVDSRVVRTIRSLRKLKYGPPRQESDSESTSTGCSTPLGDSRPSTEQMAQALSLNAEFLAIADENQLSLADLVRLIQPDLRLSRSNVHTVVMNFGNTQEGDVRRLRDRVREMLSAERIKEAKDSLAEKIAKRMQDLQERLKQT